MLNRKKILNSKKISCVIPTHKRDEYLEEAINSVIKQTQLPLEIVVSNNAPNDETKRVVNRIALKSTIPINYIEHNMKGKGPISYNLAASKSKGDYIAFLDDDDLWEPHYLEKMSIFINQRCSEITYSWFNKLKNNQKTPYKKLKENLEIKDFLLRNPGSTISNLIVEKDIFIGLGGFDDYINPSYDKDFLMRAIYFGYKYHVLEENLVTQRKHNNEQLTDINKEFLIGIKKFFKKHELHASLIIKIKFWIKFLRMIIKLFKLKKNKI
jgi:glycosyltransferase involved in cell wall biosynthesis